MTIRPAGTSLALWILGFVWGVIVFAIPTLKNTPAIPYVSKYPWISSVLTVGYVILLYYISKKHLEGASSAERIRFGSIILAVNCALNLSGYFVLLHSADHFDYLSIWVSYVLSIAIPSLATGKHESRNCTGVP